MCRWVSPDLKSDNQTRWNHVCSSGTHVGWVSTCIQTHAASSFFSPSLAERMAGSRKTLAAAADLHLPYEGWECVFRFLSDGDHHRYLEPLSLVSKQFLSITNRLRFSLTICDPTLPFLPRLFHRFPNLASLDLTRFHRDDLTSLLVEISRFPLRRLTSLNLSNHPTIPTIGLQALAEKMRTLTSLTCSNMGTIRDTDLRVIADCFPFLEELDLSYPHVFGLHVSSFALPKLRKVNFSGKYHLTNKTLFNLCKNCGRLEEVIFRWGYFITEAGIASAIRERPSLRSLSVNNRFSAERPNGSSQFISLLGSLKGLTCLDLSFLCISDELLFSIAEEALPLRKLVLQGCRNYTYDGIFCLLSKCQFVQHLDIQNAEFLNDQCVAKLSLLLGDSMSINISGCRMLTHLALFALIRNCPLLNEMKGEHIGNGNKWVEMKGKHMGNKWVAEDFNSLMVNPRHQVKSLYLGRNSQLRDETIKMFASICPNLQLLDMRYCCGVSEGVVEVLRRCCKIRHLNLAFCSRVKLLGMDFEVPKLEVLNLSHSGIDDEALHVISKCCCGLLQLDLENCSRVTTKGVKEVVESCTQLREINLGNCREVAANVVTGMVFSRPSLRKITAPPGFHPSDSQREPFLHHGCLVC